MTETLDPPPGPRRVADVQLRGPAPRARARVHWPPLVGGAPAPALVVFFADPAASGPDSARLVDRLVERIGAVVLTVSAAHAIEAHAVVAWAADHATELGAEPSRLAVVGEGAGAALAERVAELAVDEGWPPLRHVALIWLRDDRERALDRLAADLVVVSPERSR